MTIVQAIDAKSGRTTTSKNIMDALSYYFEAAEKMSIADNVKPVRGHNIVRAIDAYAGNDYSRTIVEAIDKYTGKGPSMNIMAAIENLESIEPDPPTPPTPVKTVWATGGNFSGTIKSAGSTEITPITYNPISGAGRVSITLENLTVGSDIRGTETYSSSVSDLEVIDGKPVGDINIHPNPPWPYDDPYFVPYFRIVSDQVTEGLSVVIREIEMREPYPVSWDSLKIELESNV